MSKLCADKEKAVGTYNESTNLTKRKSEEALADKKGKRKLESTK
jgi:hypothetical protein